MLKSEVLKAAKLLVFSLENKAQAVSAVSVFKAAGYLFKSVCWVYLAVSQGLSKRTALTYFNRAGLFVAV